MKKKLAALFSVVMIALLLSGCVRYEISFNFTEDEKMNVEMIVAMSDQLSELAGGEDGDESSSSVQLDEDQIKEYEEEGFTYSEYSEDGYTGYSMKSDDIDLSEINLSELFGAEDTDSISLTKDGDVYTFSIPDLMGDVTESEDSEYLDYISMMDGYMRISLALPEGSTVISDNATEKDGTKLIWDLLSLEEGEGCKASFVLPGGEVPENLPAEEEPAESEEEETSDSSEEDEANAYEELARKYLEDTIGGLTDKIFGK